MEFKKYKLGELASVDISGVDKKSKEGEKPVRLCNFTDVYKNWAITKYHYSSFMKATAKDRDIEKFSIHKGQVAITKDSETRDDIGIPTYIADNFEDVVLGYHCALITPNEKLDGKYLNAYLNSKMAKKYFEGYASGSGQRYTLTLDSINDIQIWLPDITNQKKLAQVLSDIDQKIALNTRMNAELEAMAKQLYDYWFVQFDFPDENGNPYKSSGGEMVYNSTLKREIPAGWEVENLYNLCLINRETISKNDNIETIVYLDTSNLTENRITDFIVHSRENAPSRAQRKVMDGTLLFSTVRPSQKHYGIIHNPPKNLIVSTGFATLDTIYHKDLYRIYEFLTSDATISYLSKLADTAMSSYPSINPSDIGELIITKPQTDLIDKYYCMVANTFLTIDKNVKEIKNLTHLRDSLLPMLMNGQITVE